VLVTGAIIVLPDVYGRRAVVVGTAVVLAVVLVLMLVWPLFTPKAGASDEDGDEEDGAAEEGAGTDELGAREEVPS
jgi:hypothetical protein